MPASGSHPQPAAVADPADTTAGTRAVVLTQGTNLALALSPDKRTLALDVQGVLWTLPVSGGRAVRLTDDLADVARPDWSPDGSRIVFQSYRDGGFQLWTVTPDSGVIEQLTEGEFDCREPRYSPDGAWIACASDSGGRYAIQGLNLADGSRRVLVDTDAEESEPAWSPDGAHVAFVRDGQLGCVDVATGAASHIALVERCRHPEGVVTAPAWTPDGAGLVYRLAVGTGRDMRSSRLFWNGGALTPLDEDVFPSPVAWLSETRYLYAADGQIKVRSLATSAPHAVSEIIPFEAVVSVRIPDYRRRWRDVFSEHARRVKGIAFPVLSPDARQVAFGALNQLWLLTVGDARPRCLTNDAFAKAWPSFSPDGATLAYVSDRDGNMDIWLRTLADGVERRLTGAGHALKQCSWSPDGATIACASQDGHVYCVDADSGRMRRVLHQTVWSGRPSWSPDGSQLTLAAVKPYSARYREGRNAILFQDLRTGATRYHDLGAGRALDGRNANGPIWLPDRSAGAREEGSRLVFTMHGHLWSLPLDARGAPAGDATALSDETADAISASADGRTLLYLSNGRLRLLDLPTREARPVPLELDWTPAVPRGRTIIHAGRMWDGAAAQCRENVDIVVERRRVVAIRAHAAGRDHDGPSLDGVPTRYVDASDRTVMPGLIDMHTHREMGNQLGAREPAIFLAYGITSTRGLSENAYLSLENKESVEAGARAGPRHFGTGDACDGRRTFWDGMRPIGDAAQLDRELARARDLDYDLIKAYVRLPPDLQQRLVAGAHRIGIPVTSHYLFPAVAFGADGYEHMGGTSRFGHSRTGSALGRMYQDVLALSAASGCYRTPTLFGLEPMLGDTPALIETDPRAVCLFPETERHPLLMAARAGPSAPVPMVAAQVDAIVRMLAAGVKVVSGSDYPIVAPGIGLHLNLRAMVRYGMTPAQALRTATADPGQALHPALGRIVPGALADLIFIDGDPLRDIEELVNVDASMVGGVYRPTRDVIAPFARLGAASPAGIAKNEPRTAGVSAALEDVPAAPGEAAAASSEVFQAPGDMPAAPGEVAAWWHDPRWVACARADCCGAIVPQPLFSGLRDRGGRASDRASGQDDAEAGSARAVSPAPGPVPAGHEAARAPRWGGAYRER